MPGYLWVNQVRNYVEEKEAGCIWGETNAPRREIRSLRPGDIVVHNRNYAVADISEVLDPGRPEIATVMSLPGDPGSERQGWQVQVEYHSLARPLDLSLERKGYYIGIPDADWLKQLARLLKGNHCTSHPNCLFLTELIDLIAQTGGKNELAARVPAF